MKLICLYQSLLIFKQCLYIPINLLVNQFCKIFNKNFAQNIDDPAKLGGSEVRAVSLFLIHI